MAQPRRDPRFRTAEDLPREQAKPGTTPSRRPRLLTRYKSDQHLPRPLSTPAAASSDAVAPPSPSQGVSLAHSFTRLADSIAKINVVQADRSKLQTSSDVLTTQIARIKDWDKFPAVRDAFAQNRKEQGEELAQIDATLKSHHDVRNSVEKSIANILGSQSEQSKVESHLQRVARTAQQAQEMSETSRNELIQVQRDIRSLLSDTSAAKSTIKKVSVLESSISEITRTGRENFAKRDDVEILNTLLSELKCQLENQIKSDNERDRAIKISEAQVLSFGAAIRSLDQRIRALDDQHGSHTENEKRLAERIDSLPAVAPQDMSRVDTALAALRTEVEKTDGVVKEMQEFTALKSDCHEA